MLRKLTIVLLAACCLGSGAAMAEDVSGNLGLGVEFGFMKLTAGKWDFSNIDQELGIYGRYGLKPNWSLQLSLNSGWLKPKNDAPAPNAERLPGVSALYTIRWSARLDALYHFTPEKRFVPFLGLGLGVTHLDTRNTYGQSSSFFPSGPTVWGYEEDCDYRELQFTHLSLIASLGADYYFTPGFALDFGARFHYLEGNGRDNMGLSADELYGPCSFVDANNLLVEAFVGLTWYFGNKDRDGDGVDNKLDACPEAAEDLDGFQDSDGCPDLDNDGDGIADDVDQCPDEAEDFDGYLDEDGCPDLDNDGDGILDTRDGCPDEAEDFDGFMDGDGCPDPDNDGDGVADELDECPGTPAGVAVDELGCPLVAEIKETLILKGVSFQNNKDTLTPESEAVLDEVVQSLIAWPDVRIQVQGHTDSRGKAGYNLKLSENRADAVRKYLVDHGIEPERIQAVGLGEREPIADNDTESGRATNRRVEIHRLGN